MRKNYPKSLKISPSALYTVLMLIGFGAGFTVKEFIPLELKPSALHQPFQQATLLNDPSVSVCFTPSKQCQSQIIAEINKAKKSIYVQAYSFTDQDIAQTLVNASKRGVKVQVLLDKSNRNDNRSAKDTIIQHGIPFRFDAPSGIAHNKVIILDEVITVSGSYNFSAAAYKRNTENLLIINNKNLAQKYVKNWHARWEMSK